MKLPLMNTLHLWVALRALCEFVALFVRAALSILLCSVAGPSQEQGDRVLAKSKHTDGLKTFVLYVYHYQKAGREMSHSYSSQESHRVTREQPA